MAGLPTYQTIVKPNTQSPTNAKRCQQYSFLQHSSPTTPWLWKAGQTRGRAIKIGSHTVDFNGIPGTDEMWFLLEQKFMQTPEGVNSWLGQGTGAGHYVDFHSLPVPGDVGWGSLPDGTPFYQVSPILLSYNQSGHVMTLGHDNPGTSGNQPDNGSGAGDVAPLTWGLPKPPLNVWTSIIVHVVWGRAKDYVDAGCPPGRVQVWVNSADGTVVSPANGSPSFDTINRTPAVNTLIRDLTTGGPTSGVLQKWIGPTHGIYIPTGSAQTTLPFVGQTSACHTCSQAPICVNGLLDRHFYLEMVAFRAGKTLAASIGDTSITRYTGGLFFDHSVNKPNAPTTYGDTAFTEYTDSRQRSTNTFILPPALNPNPTVPNITSFTPTSGTAGVTSVVITGTNFTGATAVTFNGIASSYVVNSATQITATCPAAATTGKIQVVTPSGTDISGLDFTVGATTAPVLPDPAASHLRVGNQTADFVTAGGVQLKAVHKRSVGAFSVAIDQAYCFIAGPPSGGSQALKVVIYDDDGVNGSPGSFLGMSNTVFVAQGVAASWVSFPFSTPAQATGGNIYYGLWFGAPASSVGYKTVVGGDWFNNNTFVSANPPSNPFGTFGTADLEAALVIDYTVAGDVRAPVFAAASMDTTVLTLDYDEALDPAKIPATSQFVVTANQIPFSVTAVAISDVSVLLTIDPAVQPADIVAVAYTAGGSGDLQDVFGNKSVSLATTAVQNNTVAPSAGDRRVDPASRVAGTRRVDAADRRTGEGGGL